MDISVAKQAVALADKIARLQKLLAQLSNAGANSALPVVIQIASADGSNHDVLNIDGDLGIVSSGSNTLGVALFNIVTAQLAAFQAALAAL